MISSAPHFCFITTRATTIAPAIGSVTTVACAALIFGNASRQPSTSPSATRLPSTFTTSSSRPVIARRPVLSILPRSPAGRSHLLLEDRRRGIPDLRCLIVAQLLEDRVRGDVEVALL